MFQRVFTGMVRKGLLLAVIFLLLSGSLCSVFADTAAHTVVDQLGRRVSLPAKVERIIPLGGATRLVVYVQAFDLVVGVEAMETSQPVSGGRPYNLAIRKQAENLPVVGEGKQKPINAEAVLALKPDLLIIGGTDRAQADYLARLTGIPVLALDYGGLGVLKLEQISDAFVLLGKVLKREKRAKQLVDELVRQKQELAKRLANVKALPVYAGAVSQRGAQGITSTDTDYYPLEISGARNLAKQLGQKGHFFIDKEQLLVWNPPFMLIDAGGAALVKQDYRINKGFYQQLNAIKNRQVYQTLPYNYYHTNLELALANGWYVAKLLHPQRFTDINPATKTDELCSFFNGITCYQQLQQEFGGFGRLKFE